MSSSTLDETGSEDSDGTVTPAALRTAEYSLSEGAIFTIQMVLMSFGVFTFRDDLLTGVSSGHEIVTTACETIAACSCFWRRIKLRSWLRRIRRWTALR